MSEGGGEGDLHGVNHQHNVFCFGNFRLDPVSRTLLQDGSRLHLPARLFDTLLYLVQHHDRLVERDELCRAIWSTNAVSEGNLGRAISSLRLSLKSAGEEGVIVTAPGRGYRFGKPVRVEMANYPDPAPVTIFEAPPPSRTSVWKRPGFLAAIVGPLLAMLGLAAFVLWPRPVAPGGAGVAGFTPPPHSIAVLPFANHGADAADTLYSDGIAQELINALGRIDGLKVAASTSSFLFRNKNVAIGDIARQLNVGALLEGSVQREAGHVHVTVELIDAHNGYQVWSHVYDQGQGDILVMQGQIAEAAVAALKGVVLGNEAARLTLGGTTNPEAFDAYLKGVAELNAMDADANRRAVTDFNKAVELDPRYALAFAYRARALSFIATFGNSPDVDYSHRVRAAALEDAEHAVALAPDLGAAHADLAFVLHTSLADLGRAQNEYRRAIALAPSDTATLLNYARFQLEMGYTQEAIEAAEQVVQLDPLAAKTYGNLTIILEYARHYDDARQALRRTLVLAPGNTTFKRVTLGMLGILQGHADEALRVCGGNVDYRDMSCLAMADHMLGRQADAEAELAKARAILGNNGAFLYARIYAQWGQATEALRWLQIAYQLRDPGLIELKIDPALDPIRGLPEFNDLIRKVGLPDGIKRS